MSLEKILSVSGRSGLFRLVAQMKNGIIVESLEDAKRMPVHGTTKVSTLNEISIYTSAEEVPLSEVFKRIYEKNNGKPVSLDKNDVKKVTAFFKSIVPDFDESRVYTSDMVKVVKWYNQLIEKAGYDPTKPEETTEEKVAETTEETDKAKTTEKKTKKTTVKKQGAATTKAAKTNVKARTTAVATPRKAGGTSRGS